MAPRTYPSGSLGLRYICDTPLKWSYYDHGHTALSRAKLAGFLVQFGPLVPAESGHPRCHRLAPQPAHSRVALAPADIEEQPFKSRLR